jgi:hypothetical protein
VAPQYVIVSNDGLDPFILCVEDGEPTSVQLADYQRNPAAFAGLVWRTADVATAQRAVERARARAADWRCAPRSIGIYRIA